MNRASAAGPLVSIVVRTKDRPDTLREALESIAAQTWRPLEAVVVNDGGVPVEGVTAALEGRLTLRRVEHPESRGRAAAANAGVRAARGDWVGFLDDDDLYLPQHVATVHGAAAAAGTAAAYAACRVVHPGAGPEGEVLAHPYDPELLPVANFIPTCAVLIRREAILHAGGFDEDLPFLEDWDLWIRLSRATDFAFTPEVTSVYRAGPASVGGDMAPERWAVMEELFARHWERIRPPALARRLRWLEGDLAGLRHELRRVAAQLAGCEERLAGAVRDRDEVTARLAETLAQRDELRAELERVRAEYRAHLPVVRGATRLRLHGLLARLGRTGGSGGEEGG